MKKTGRLLVLPVLLAYLALAVLYAVYTPPWQVPDEPAHYNYIRAIAERGTLPVIEEGDYDHAYIRRLVDNGFPPDLSIEPLTYEDHQPPLYYLLAVPVYLLFDGALLPLRLVSVAAGLVVLLAAWGVARLLLPDRPLPALAATLFVAFLPQHLAMTAGVNNDALAEVMVGWGFWLAVRLTASRPPTSPRQTRRLIWALGLVVGLAVLTKTTAYVVLPVALVAVALRGWQEGWPWRQTAGQCGRMILVATLLAGPWLARNVAVYGWRDPLGLARHNSVVVGQPRTAAWVAQYGWAGLLARMARTTFQSFWGQFGWMGVPLQPAVYQALALFSALLAIGFAGWKLDRRRIVPAVPSPGGALLALSALLTLASYLWYNLTFVQHQGRYLFPALIPLAVGAALGLEWLLSLPVARWAAAVAGGSGALLLLGGLAWEGLSPLPGVAALGLSALLAGTALLPRLGRWVALAALAAGLVALDLYALFGAILPMLAR